MNKLKLIALLGVVFATGFFAGKFSTNVGTEKEEEPQGLINGFAYLDALEKAADLASEKVCYDDRLLQWQLNHFSGLAADITERLIQSLDIEIRLSDDFPLFEEEYDKEYWEWQEAFEKAMSEPSMYEGGTAEGMDLAGRRNYLLYQRAKELKSKWFSRLPVPYFEPPRQPTEEELEAWEEEERRWEEAQSKAGNEEEIVP